MKAPDKIYLERDKETNKIHHLWGRDAVISSFYEHIEYIRKEALLEWLNENVQELNDTPSQQFEYYENGKIIGRLGAFEQVIDKLNEM